jgi:hypothetical protein
MSTIGTSTRTRVVVIAAVASTAFAALAIVACLDPSPYTMPASASDAAPPLDASRDGDAAIVTTCTTCLQTPDTPGPGCADEVAACKASAKCNVALECALANACFERGSLEKLVACGLPCAQDAGIVSNDDPALSQAYDLFHCAGTTCGGPCHLNGDVVDASFLD